MYVILVYDIGEERVTRALKICRQYLTWVQNSVFEGETTEAKLGKLKLRLKQLMVHDQDSVLIYRLREQRYMEKEVLGLEKNTADTFL
ncbi:CRISPR-associated endonuclease Cas2 [bacterium]|nr:CRISPR-associated endonuclease Cas2 [bacterium]